MKNKEATCISCKKSFCVCADSGIVSNPKTLKGAIAEIMDGMSDQIKLIQIRAKLCRVYHLALIEEGYSEDETLEICKYFQP